MSDNDFSRNLRAYYISEFLGSLFFTIPVWVAFQRSFLSFTQMSLLAGFMLGMQLLLEIPTGAVADLFGKRLSVILGLTVSFFGTLIMGFSDNAPQIFLGGAIVSLGTALISGANVALIYEILKDRHKENLFPKIRSNDVLCLQVGIIVSSIAAGYLFAIRPWLPFLMEGVAFLVSATVVLFFIKEPAFQKEHFSFSSYFQQISLGFREISKNQFIRNLSLFYALVGGLTWSWQIYFNQIYASALGYNEVDKGWLFAIIRFVNAIILFRIFHVEKSISKNRIFGLFLFLITFVTLFTVWADKNLGTLLLFVMTFSSTIRFIALDNYVNAEFESKYRATAMSSLNMLVSLVFVIIVSLSGPLLDRFPVGITYFLWGIVTLILLLPKTFSLAKKN